jgi:biopolymer transport protein TolQ
MTDFSLWSLLGKASPLALLVLLLLVAASVLSWALILSKRKVYAAALQQAEAFEARFWSGINLSELYDSLKRQPESGLAALFKAGYQELGRQRSGQPEDVLAGVQRALRIAKLKEVEKLEDHLAIIATIGSTSPYVGLFGTVWGIINAFIAIGGMKQATLATVAPGIAEALIATAMGLFAAIPSVVAYNFFTAKLDRLENRFTTFGDELLGIIDRNLRKV